MTKGNRKQNAYLRHSPPTPPGEKSVSLRIWSTIEALEAFADLTPRERGDIVRAWFERREAADE